MPRRDLRVRHPPPPHRTSERHQSCYRRRSENLDFQKSCARFFVYPDQTPPGFIVRSSHEVKSILIADGYQNHRTTVPVLLLKLKSFCHSRVKAIITKNPDASRSQRYSLRPAGHWSFGVIAEAPLVEAKGRPQGVPLRNGGGCLSLFGARRA